MRKFVVELYRFFRFYQSYRRMRGSLPAVFESVDQVLPEAIAEKTPRQIESLIATSIRRATGKKASKIDVDTVTRLYSPVEAAKRKHKKAK